MTFPKITVVTPSYNQGPYIERTIDSVLSQGYPNLEYIIIDGGSTDDSAATIRKYEKHVAYWVSEPDNGQSDALNKGFRHSTGDLLTWLNSDDWHVNGALHLFADAFLGNPKCGIVVGSGTIVDIQGQILHQCTPADPISFDSLCSWISGNMFMQPSSAMSRAAWEACGPIDLNEHLAMDVDLWLRIAKSGFDIVVRDEHISESLSHADAKTTEFAEESIIACARVIAKHGSVRGYEDAMAIFLKKVVNARQSLAWYDKHYATVTAHPFIRRVRPILKRLGSESSIWPERIPQWIMRK